MIKAHYVKNLRYYYLYINAPSHVNKSYEYVLHIIINEVICMHIFVLCISVFNNSNFEHMLY